MASLAVAGVPGTGHLALGRVRVGALGGLGGVRLDSASVARGVSGRRCAKAIVCSAASTDVLPKASADADVSNGTVTVSNISKFIDSGSMKRLKALYEEEIVPVLLKEFEYTNKLQVPKLEKIVVNCGVGDASQNAKALDGAKKDLSIATGQQPVVTRAKKAIAGFKVRENMAVGLATTLRGELMYSFIDRLVNLVLPRMRDFGGLNKGSFDGRGNYSLGLKEQTLFPEIPYDQIDRTRGMDITLVTSAKSDREAKRLLELLGLKFREQASAPVVKKPKKKNYRR